MNTHSPAQGLEDRSSKRRKRARKTGMGNRVRNTVVLDYETNFQPAPLHVEAGLEPNTSPLSESQAGHLLRRTQFGASPARVKEIAGRPAHEVVDELLLSARNAPLPATPSWYNLFPDYENGDEEAYFEQSIEWFYEMTGKFFERVQTNALAEKMALFWHNHFVTEFFEGLDIAPLAFRYDAKLRTHGFGNFKSFVHTVGLDMTMLVYLNGAQNTVEAPNENYARELCELFTMGIRDRSGQANYTEKDISELARALTGYVVNEETWQVEFEQELFDAGSKTFFGQKGPWGYGDAIDILFAQRSSQIAYHICQQLYKEFVYEAPQPDIVLGLAQAFEASNFDINAVLSTLLKSQHFFDSAFHVARIKSPFELFAGYLVEMGIDQSNYADLYLELSYSCEEVGQILLNPPNVAGFPGYRSWLTTSSVPARWEILGLMTFEALSKTGLMNIVQAIHDPNDAHAVFKLPVAIVQHLIGAPVESLSIQPISAPWSGGRAIPAEIEQGPKYVHHLTKQLLSGTPWYEWDVNSMEAEFAIREFIAYVQRLPEYQLT